MTSEDIKHQIIIIIIIIKLALQVYVDFFLPVLWDAIYGYILAGLVFVLSIRLLRVLGYNQRITMLATVLSRSGPALVGYSLVFFIILSAYASAGHVMFVTSMEQFRSMLSTYSTLYIVLLGTNRIGRWTRTSPLWAQAYYISFTFLVLFVLYSMFQVSPVGDVRSQDCVELTWKARVSFAF